MRASGTLLSNPNRRAIAERVALAPGASIQRLADAVGVDYKTAQYHARVLAEAGVLVVRRLDRRRTACYPAGAAGEAPRARPAPSRAVAALVALQGGARSASQMAAALGVPRSTASMMLRRLRDRGLATRDERGWSAAGDAARLLAEGRPGGRARPMPWTAPGSAS